MCPKAGFGGGKVSTHTKVSLKTPTKEAEVKKPEKKRKPYTNDAEEPK